jgi:hypothetical protein
MGNGFVAWEFEAARKGLAGTDRFGFHDADQFSMRGFGLRRYGIREHSGKESVIRCQEAGESPRARGLAPARQDLPVRGDSLGMRTVRENGRKLSEAGYVSWKGR